jgi:hypothetical protein
MRSIASAPSRNVTSSSFRYLQQKRASKRGDQVEGDSDDSCGLGCASGGQAAAIGSQVEGRAASPPTVIATTTTLSKSGHANKYVSV